jgi:hypothetical protein
MILNEFLANHQICKAQKCLRRQQVRKCFSGWIEESHFNDYHLSLYRFASTRPLKYYDPKCIDALLNFFQDNADKTLEGIFDKNINLSHAILSLIREGTSWNNEDQLKLDDPTSLSQIESIWHPEYQRYCEHVLNHLIRIPLGVLEKIQKKDYLSFSLSKQIDALRSNGLDSLCSGFSSTVRNAISHGSISFKLSEIEYKDRAKEPLVLFPYELAELFDNLVDTCHSILIALLLFLSAHHNEMASRLERLPLGLRYLFIDASSSHHGFKILSMTESTTVNDRKQLNVSCQIKTLSRISQMFDGLSLAWHALKFGGQNYDRIAIILDCGKEVSPALFINANRLRRAIIGNEEFEDCIREVLESSLLWFDASNLRRKIYVMRSLAKLFWQTTRQQFVDEWRNRGLKVLYSRYHIRTIENRSTESIRRFQAHVILNERGTITDTVLKDILRHAIRTLRKYQIKRRSFGDKGWFKGRPNCIWIRLYARDKRFRSLFSEGWADKNLILQAEWFSRWKDKGPVTIEKPDTTFHRIRIKYNPLLLKNAGTSAKGN